VEDAMAPAILFALIALALTYAFFRLQFRMLDFMATFVGATIPFGLLLRHMVSDQQTVYGDDRYRVSVLGLVPMVLIIAASRWGIATANNLDVQNPWLRILCIASGWGLIGGFFALCGFVSFGIAKYAGGPITTEMLVVAASISLSAAPALILERRVRAKRKG